MSVNFDDLTDEQLRTEVIRQLDEEPLISTTEVGIITSEGVVTLTGYVNREDEIHLAETVVQRVPGVRGIANELEVKPFTILTDTDIAKNALQALESEPGLNEKRITVTVEDGFVTLYGDVDDELQRQLAAQVVQDLLGVQGVTNNLGISV